MVSMKWISRSILALIWNGLMVDVESILAPFGINVGSILEANWNPFGVHFGVNLGSMSRAGRDSCLRPRRDQISDPLDRSWRFSWTPCWPHVGSMLEAVGRLEGSLGVSGPI